MSGDSCSGHTVKEKIEYFNKFSRLLASIHTTHLPHALEHETACSVGAEECDELVIFDECVCVEDEIDIRLSIPEQRDLAICTRTDEVIENETRDQDLTLTKQRGVADYFGWIRKEN
jgi:hypothetical protein